MNRSTQVLGVIALAFLAQAANAQWQFNNCTATGPTGPTQGACDTEYSGTDLDGAVTLSGGIQTWTVPATGIYRIEVSGAAGGDSIAGQNGTFIGGGGATVAGDFQLTAGEQLSILVGQLGTTPPTQPSNSPLGGGGGGSFVWRVTGNELLIAAGGGGGAGDGYATSTDANGADGVTTSMGSLPGGIDPCVSLAAAGEGWTTANYACGGYHAGGGAGWNSNGAIYAMDCDSTGTDALSPLNGGTGGNGNDDLEPETGPGGFGGGGGSATECGSTGGGGGGGYTGGAGPGCQSDPQGYGCGPGGGGGGSYNSGANPTGSDGANTGHGAVMITALEIAEPAPVPVLSNWGLVLLVLMLMGVLAIRSRSKLLG